MSEFESNFMKGYTCALACIVSGHGSCVAIEEALAANGVTIKRMLEAGCDQFDIDILSPTIKFMEGK